MHSFGGKSSVLEWNERLRDAKKVVEVAVKIDTMLMSQMMHFH